MEKFNLSALTDEQCKNFVALLNSKLFEHLGFYKDARYIGREDITVCDEPALSLKLVVDGRIEREHYSEQKEVEMSLLLDEFLCFRVVTDHIDGRNPLIKKQISKVWREFLLAEFNDEYKPLLDRFTELKRQELLAKQQEEMQNFNTEYNYNSTTTIAD